MKVLVFDTETTGLPASRNLSLRDVDKWPHIIQLSYILYDTELNKTCSCVDDIITLADDVHISAKSIKMHGITRSMSIRKGIQIADALHNFNNVLQEADWVIAHNISFDKQRSAAITAASVYTTFQVSCSYFGWREIDANGFTRCSIGNDWQLGFLKCFRCGKVP